MAQYRHGSCADCVIPKHLENTGGVAIPSQNLSTKEFAMSEAVTETGTHTRVSLDEVRHVADLANLALTGEELSRMTRDLHAVLGYIAQLNELDTTDLAAMSQVSQALGLEPAKAGEALRRDETRPSVDRSLVMADAPETDGRFFKVPKVIER